MARSPLAELSSLVVVLNSAPVEIGVGVEPLSAAPGHVRARIPLDGPNRRIDGRAHPAVLGVAADLGVGVAVNSLVDDSTGGPTVELHLSLIRDPDPRAQALYVEGHALHVTSTTGWGRAIITDDSGNVIAEAVGLMATNPGPHPRLSKTPLAQFDPDLLQLRELSADGMRSNVAVKEQMLNSQGIVHGGVLTGLAELAQEAACGGSGTTKPVSLTIQFLRPVLADAAQLECRSTYVRSGRRFHVIRTSILRTDGVMVAEVTGNCSVSAV